jgi:hypothetical protein
MIICRAEIQSCTVTAVERRRAASLKNAGSGFTEEYC